MLVGLLLVVCLALWPAREMPIGEIPAFVPVIDAVVAAGELIIAAKLYAQAAVFRSNALALLASGFVLVGVLIAGHALTFPGAFAPEGLIGSGTNPTAWIMIFRRVGFPLVILAYVLLKSVESRQAPEVRRPPVRVAAWILGAIALAGAGIALAVIGDDVLPPMFSNRVDAVAGNQLVFNICNISLVILGMMALFVQRRSVLDLWLLVGLAGALIVSLLNLTLHARFTVGWYVLFLVILFAHLFVLLALIVESNRLYSRLAMATAARYRERDTRMMSVEAVAATMAREVGQDLAAVTLSASAGLNYLTSPKPDAEMAIRSVQDTLEAGQRAFDVIQGMQAAFAHGETSTGEYDLNELVRETVSSLQGEFAAHKIAITLALDKALPPVLGDRARIQRVVTDLLTNSVNAIEAAGRPVRRIRVRSGSPDAASVLLEVTDSGVGLTPGQLDHIFDPFFTTKPAAMGISLWLSRIVVEENGGRLWATVAKTHGATFHLQLPGKLTE